MAAASSLRNLGRVLRNQALNTIDCRPVLDRLTGRGRSRSEVAKSIRTIFEALEGRQMLSVLPAPQVSNWQSISGNASTSSPTYNTAPSTAVDPLNPLRAVTVYTFNNPSANGNQKVFIRYSYTSDGGVTWSNPVNLPGNIDDPELTTNSHVPYAQATDATVSFDRYGNFYVGYSEHNAGNTSGAIVLQAYKWTAGGAPAIIAQTPTSPPITASTTDTNKILYRWVGADSAWTPTLAVDNNLPSFVDPETGDTQTDNFSGTIYVAWATNDQNSAVTPAPLPNYNPNTIRLVSVSWDDPLARTTLNASSPQIWNSNGHSNPVHAVMPKIVISQGNATDGSTTPAVPGGQVTIIWDDINSGRNASPPVDRIMATVGTSGGSAYENVNTTVTPIIDAAAQLFNNPTTINVHNPTNGANAPNQVLGGNFDSDALMDAVVLGTTSDDISILRGRGNGTFIAAVHVPASPAPGATAIAFAMGDFDGDKKTDLLVVDSNGVNLLTGTGSATTWFNAATQVYNAGGAALTAIEVGDFNGDKNLDFVVTDSTNGAVVVMLGNGDGTFTADPASPTNDGKFSVGGTSPVAVRIADMNGDSVPDIIVANAGTLEVRVLLGVKDPVLNTGTGDFTLSQSFALNDTPVSLQVGDLDNDKRPDVVVVTPTVIQQFTNNTIGPTFDLNAGPNFVPQAGDTPNDVAIVDLNGDNLADLVISNSGSNRLVVAQRTAAGRFVVPANPNIAYYAVGANPTGMTLADFNGDNKADLMVVNTDDDTVSLLTRPGTAATITAGTSITVNVNITDPSFSLSDVDVDLGIVHPATGELLITLTAPNGNTIVLIQNRLTPNGTRQWTVANPMGISGVDIGYILNGNFENYVGLTIGSAVRNINDTSYNGIGTYLPEGSQFRNTQTLMQLLGYNPGDDATVLNGSWTMTVTDMVVTTPPPFQAITHFGVRLTSNTQPDANAEYNVTTTTVLGALDPSNNPRASAAAGVTGIGPGIQVASDNTLGSFSSHQGRIYVTFVNRDAVTAGNPSDNTDVMLIYSDNGGRTWQGLTRVNDDNALTDGYSEAVGATSSLTTRGRPQFQPAIAVDQFTGTLVISYYDARQDASRTRVARYLATSIDGGSTFAPQSYLNVPNQVVDATTGKTINLGAVPDNGSQNDDPNWGFGYEQGLAVLNGNVYATWSGNQNGSTYTDTNGVITVVPNGRHLPDILTATTHISAGPRVVGSTMGDVSQPGDLLNKPAADGTPQLSSFVLVFDRPVDISTIHTHGADQNVFLFYRVPGASGNDQGAPVALRFDAVALGIDVIPFDPVTGVDLAYTPGMSVVAVRVELASPDTRVGTYSYYVNPTISDRIRKAVTVTNPAYRTTGYVSDAADSNLVVPNTGTGGSSTASDNDTTSVINVNGMPTADQPEVITAINVKINLLHTNVSNLTFTLVAPDGVHKYVLGSAPIKGGRNMTNTVFSSNGTASFTAGTAPYTGTFKTVDNLSALITLLNIPTTSSGLSRDGNWQLVVTDNQTNDTGTLLNWTLSFDTSITTGMLGNPMDQNGDATPGASAWSNTTIGDVYANPNPVNDNAWDKDTQTFHTPYNNTNSLPLIVPGPSVSTTQTFQNQDGAKSIVDPPSPAQVGQPAYTTTSTIHIAGDATRSISNLTVTINDLRHPSADTLKIELIAPDGTVILLHRAELFYHPPGQIPPDLSSDVIPNMIGLVFNDNASLFVGDVKSSATLNASGTPYTGQFKPDGLDGVPSGGLSSLNGKALGGDWTLRVTDTQPDGNGGAAVLNGWSITATTTPVTVNPVQTDVNSTPTVNSIVVTFDRDMDANLMTVPGAIAGAVSPVLGIQGPLGPIAVSPTYSSTTAQSNLPIPDNGTATSTINVADTYKVGHVSVKLDIAHASDQDLIVSLVGPDNTTITLINHRGGNAVPNFTGTILDDFGSVGIATGSAPFSGGLGYIPEQALSAFIGKGVQGNWKLQVTDSAGNAVTGVVNSWSLTVTPQIVAVGPGDPAYDPNYTVANRTFRIYIPDQKVSGSYSLTLNPQLGATVAAGAWKLDSDKNAGVDALRNAVVATNVSATTPTVPYIYTQNTPKPIPVATDSLTPSVIRSVLTVTDDFQIQNLTVRLNALFANVPDLTITLTAPDGVTTVTLFNQFGAVGSNRANLTNTVFSDAATTPIQNGSAPYTATFKPASPVLNPLSDFNGLHIRGDWTLTVTSKSTAIAGTLVNWSMTASKAVTNTGLGQAGADQATVNFRIFNMNGGNTSSSNQWTPVTSTGSSAVTPGSNADPTSLVNNGNYNTTNTLSAGSITDVAVDPSDPSGNTVFVATASGGVWKTTNFLTSDPNGPTYVPLTDFGPVNGLNVGSLAVFGQTATAPANVKLTGTLFATAGSYAPGFTAGNAFDGSTQTFFWGPDADYDYVGYQFASPTLVTQVKFAPATSFGSNMVGGKIQGSTDGTHWTDLYTITSAPLDGALTTVNLTTPGTFSYVRYLGPVGINAHAMISELEFYGPAANTVSAGASNKSVIVAGTGQGSAGYTDVSASTTNKVLQSPGVGFLLSTDGGATWNLLDSLTNVDSAGNWLPIGSPQRDHRFVGTATFKVVVDPRPTPSGDVIIYAALTGPNGGLYRSTDTGKHWQLMRAGDCTDVILDYNSATLNSQGSPTGNLQTLYAGFRGEGVFTSPNRGATWNQLLGNAGGTPNILDGSVTGRPAIKTLNPADPNGNKGRVVLAMPSPTGNAAADTLHQQWIYAAVITADSQNYWGKLDGLYMTKDGGLNWTEIPLAKIAGTTFAPTNDASTGATYNVVDSSGVPQGVGNYSITLAVDPTNPAILYVGGAADATGYGLVRVDTTRIYDAHSFYTPQDANDGGQLAHDVTAAVVTKDLTSISGSNPFGSGTLSTVDQNQLGTAPSPQFINLTTDPTNPFAQNSTFMVRNATSWQNTGADAYWHPIDYLFTMPVFSPNSQRVMTMIDPVTGQTRLILANDSGVYTTVSAADGSYGGVLGSNVALAQGSRNGNLQNAQVVNGAVQPGSLASQLAGAMFYAMTNTNGMVTSDPNVLTNGDVTGSTSYDTAKGTGVAADQTGSGTAYGDFIPFDSGTDFFQVFPPGTSFNNVIDFLPPNIGGIGRTLGLITSTTGTGSSNTHDSQWPDYQSFNFAVNPINGNQIAIGSWNGSVYSTYNQGRLWSLIASPSNLDGSIPYAFAYGAPDTSSDSLSNLIYVGTSGVFGNTGSTTTTPPTTSRGQVFVSFNGGGSIGSNNWVNLDPNGLDGSPVRSIVANPNRGSHELYVATDKGVYYMADSSVPGAKWVNITGTLLTASHTYFGNTNYSEVFTQTLTSVTADWRYAIPNANGVGTHPILYAAGNSGVYRSVDNGKTWTLFPNQSVDGAAADGGYLPNVKVTDLDLALGNINPTTGLPVTTADSPNVLLASTYGRGQYAIRIAPIVFTPAFGQDTLAGDRTLTGLTQLNLNPLGAGMTFKVYNASDPTHLVEVPAGPGGVIGTPTYNPDGTFSITISKNYSATKFVVQAIDASGVAGPVSAAVALPPATPDTPVLAVGEDTGSINNDNKTNHNKPKIDNHTAGTPTVVPNAVVKIYLDTPTSPLNTPVGSVVADANGHWSFTFLNTLSSGSHSIRITQTDPTSNLTSSLSAPLVITIDTTGPAGQSKTIGSTTTTSTLSNIIVATFTEPNGLDASSVKINWGDGTTTAGTLTQTGATTWDVTGTHGYTVKGNYTISVSASDTVGNSSTVNDSVVVTAPVYNFSLIGQTIDANEGDAIVGKRIGVVVDGAVGHTTSNLTAMINWGDGTAPTAGQIVVNTDGQGTFDVLGTHTYIDNRQGGPPAYEVTVTVTASDGKVATQQTGSLAKILNTPPTATVTPTGSTSAYVGQSLSFTFGATDHSSADAAAGFKYVINWGDGSPLQTINPTANNGSGVTLSHTFVAASSSVTVQAFDKDSDHNASVVVSQPVNVHGSPTLNSSAINGDPSRSDITQITFNLANTDVAGGLSLSNLFLYYNGDGVNALSLAGATLTFDAASGAGTLDLSHLVTPLADGDYQLQIKVAGQVFVVPFFKLSGDLTGDGKVDAADQTKLQNAMGKSSGQPGFYAQADLNHDGTVNAADLTLFATYKNRKASGGIANLTLKTGSVGAVPTINFGSIPTNTNGGYIDLYIKNGNANSVQLNLGKMSVVNPNFTFALADQAWGQLTANTSVALTFNKPVKIRIYLKPVTKAQTLAGKFKFSYSTLNKQDYKDVTVNLKAVITNPALKQKAVKKAAAKKK